MLRFRMRRPYFWVVAIAAALVVCLGAPLLRSKLEHMVRARIEAMTASHGAVARIGLVHVGVWPLLQLRGIDLDLGHGVQFHADLLTATWPGHLRLAVRAATLAGPAGVRASSPASAWDVEGIRGESLQLTLVEPQAGLSIRKLPDLAGNAWSIQARGLEVGRLLALQRNVSPLFGGGIADGRLDFRQSANTLRFHVDMGTRGVRLGVLTDSTDDDPQLGDPTDVTMRFDGTWRRVEGTLEIPEVQATLAGAAVSGSVALRSLNSDATVDLALGVQHLDFAQVLGASGVAIPESLGLAGAGDTDLGSAMIDVHVRGRLADPASLSVTQNIDFRRPHQLPPAVARLQRDFTFSPDDGSGPHRSIDVSDASADFIPLHDVPPLFIRTLLISEDAGFYGHRGIDLRELPAALITDWTRGGAARGGSTITQQLAKNLFLSRNKQLGRKLQELAVTFLLEAALSKNRILEIYLNIIEWGPDLHGLRPAARHYFGREPGALTPAQIAFLITIIPGPIKYQSSFAHGTPGPGLSSLVDALLTKLRSAHAISDEEYLKALSEPIVVGDGGSPH